MKKTLLLSLLLYNAITALAQTDIDRYNPTWTSQSKNSSESMPCGGGDIGLNVWVEHGELLFYIARSGTFDENNAMLKLGRIRVKLSPNPFDGGEFKQELTLHNGTVFIDGKSSGISAQIKLWVDVYRPVIHLSIKSNKAIKTEAAFESWRYQDRSVKGTENNQGSWKFSPQGQVKTLKDEIAFNNDGVLFYHHNLDSTIFDVTVKQQGMDAVKQQIFNPLKNLTFGGLMRGANLKPAGTYKGKYINTDFEGWKLQSIKPVRNQDIDIYLNTEQAASADQWQNGLNKVIQDARVNQKTAWQKTADWWKQYWDKSFVFINTNKPAADTAAYQTGKNYQLFRYMLGCNAYGQYPTKFNGGLFTYDPVFVNPKTDYTPDFRNWGGGLMTAQNQRLVYFPMLKSGDFDLMKPQFDFYLRSLHNAELRSQVYWGHQGACFTEQVENFGLPNSAEYAWKRPVSFDKGVEYNTWLEYTWDTVFEFCLMMLETEHYAGKDIHQYIPFIESCLTFFDEHYQYLSRLRSSKALDGNGHLVLYPGSSTETFKMTYNSNSTIAALQTITQRLLALPDNYLNNTERLKLQGLLKRIPPLSFGETDGHKVFTPAKSWERVSNVESPQFYPVFPWGIFGVGKPGIDIPLNTWKLDTLAIKFRSGIGWKQDNIFAARLGLTKEAAELTTFKLKDSGRRFPAFWGPGFDWTPDHNWGGSGMIGLQEMLLQVDDKKIYLFPSWPKDWDVHFKLHAPYNTTVEATLRDGKVKDLKVFPEERKKDITMMIQ
ncbi:DUF5703 domain-containing protein [Mucilaginibacter sabulilitoris]|uniref:DUF5703 domain-containing protein n=1 Tax=Mucilaginibacter sabulilitoris TaxID=1173583 RepID=A0ABZ0U027_9SPHI|nr:DUF5703 domain-containing protein [Mucilaginibacter sabulilitoris]WPU96715.1 DUF5703 domain-containing protein [Mucilaginibacter sabulilitoris]